VRKAAASVDEYLAGVPDGPREALEKLRATIRSVVPTATEGISYQIPMFKLNGKPLVSFAAFKGHCSFFVQSPGLMQEHAAELASYSTAKGTIHFSPSKPLPAALVRKLVRARIRENEWAKSRVVKAKEGPDEH